MRFVKQVVAALAFAVVVIFAFASVASAGTNSGAWTCDGGRNVFSGANSNLGGASGSTRDNAGNICGTMGIRLTYRTGPTSYYYTSWVYNSTFASKTVTGVSLTQSTHSASAYGIWSPVSVNMSPR